MLNHDERYLVAVSGGADSVCLLLVLKQLGYAVEAVHCNFNLRGDESRRDEQFVKDLCKNENIKLHLIHFDTITYADMHKVSIEMAARELRYRYFEQLRCDIGAAGICVAHHQDDSVETVLMNLLRGTGIHGLSGIKPRNGFVLRPLLCVNRQQIEAWLEQQHQAFITDSSNLCNDILRNKLRLDIIPRLQDVLPGACKGILNTAKNIGEATLVYDQSMRETFNRLKKSDFIDVQDLLNEPSPESVLFEWLTPLGFPHAVIEQIAAVLPVAQSGREWRSDTHQLTVSRGQLIAEPLDGERPTLCLPEPGTYVYTGNIRIRVKVESFKTIIRAENCACLDADTVHFPLTLRPIRKGDRFQPYGMKGTRLVSDFLTDRHLSVFEKRRTLVLTDGSGQILWVAGHRPDGRFCVGEDTTRTLVVKYDDSLS